MTLLASGEWVEAESLAVRATPSGRGASFFENTLPGPGGTGPLRGRRRRRSTRYAEKAPASPTLLDQRARLAFAQGDYAAGTRLLLQLRDAQRASLGWQARTNNFLALVSRLTGKLGRLGALPARVHGRQRWPKGSGRLRGRRRAARPAAARFSRAARIPAIAILAAALAKHPLASIPADGPPVSGPRRGLREAGPDGGRAAPHPRGRSGGARSDAPGRASHLVRGRRVGRGRGPSG